MASASTSSSAASAAAAAESSSSEDVKNFLYSWLGRRKKGPPEYDVRPAGSRHRQRFLCTLNVPGYEYVACGNSSNKKDAQTNAARDFVQFLERRGELKEEEVPKSARGTSGGAGVGGGGFKGSVPDLGLHQRHWAQPGSLGEAYRPAGDSSQGQSGSGGGGGGGREFNRQFLEAAQRRRVEEAEEADVNASLHGNWTVENAKSRLHMWMQDNKVKADYRYSTMGPDHNKSFVAEMRFYVRQLGREVAARETASNKQSASKSCALSMVRQLFHLGVVEAFSGTLKRNKDVEELKPLEAALSPELEARAAETLEALKLPVVDVSKAQLKDGESLSLLTESSTILPTAAGEILSYSIV